MKINTLSTQIMTLAFLKSLLFLLSLSLFPTSNIWAEEWIYTTRPNDTLWGISKRYLQSANDWSKLQKYNNVDVAKQLKPGTKLRIPMPWMKGESSPAIVVSVRGVVQHVLVDTKESIQLTKKQTIKVGESLITGANASALIQFADGSTLLIQSNSQVDFNTLSSFGPTGMVDTQLRLQQGRVETSIKPLRTKSSRYEITTPAAVAAVRGTQFRVAYLTEKEKMASEVVEGKINLAAQGAAQGVDAGYGSLTKKGEAPSPPVKLLEKPSLQGLTKHIKYQPIELNWANLNGALHYRIQLAAADNPDASVFEATSNTSSYDLAGIDDGNYIIKIRGIDAQELEGFNAEQALKIDSSMAQAILSTEDNSHFATQPFSLEWVKNEQALHYRIQVATDNKFSHVVVNQHIKTANYTPISKMAAGQYYWRVAAADENRQIAIYSETREFSVAEVKDSIWYKLLYFWPLLLFI